LAQVSVGRVRTSHAAGAAAPSRLPLAAAAAAATAAAAAAVHAAAVHAAACFLQPLGQRDRRFQGNARAARLALWMRKQECTRVRRMSRGGGGGRQRRVQHRATTQSRPLHIDLGAAAVPCTGHAAARTSCLFAHNYSIASSPRGRRSRTGPPAAPAPGPTQPAPPPPPPHRYRARG